MAKGLEHLTFTAQISDPVWGAFPITALEEELLATRELSRLNHIKQMGLAFLDFPSLTHTRLEHSLGVMYVADQILTTLRDTASAKFKGKPDVLERLFNPLNHQAVRLAALLHDLGHPPFSHAVELTFVRYPRLLEEAAKEIEKTGEGPDKVQLLREYSHETFTRWRIKNFKGLKPILARHDMKQKGLVGEIADLAVGKATGPLESFNPIISGDFDADRIDYLIRDNRHSGFTIGLSPDELYNAVHLARFDDGGKDRFEIYIDKNALPFVNSVFSARERLINRVHLAPAGRAATQMLNKFLFEVLEREGPGTLADIIMNLHCQCTDYTFFDELNSRVRAAAKRTVIADAPQQKIHKLIKIPSKAFVWQQFAHLSFMRMNPCLRLLVYLCATAKYESPRDLILKVGASPTLFIEPSTRPAPRFSLRVDFDCKPNKPSFDFIASSENRLGRAVLAQSLSNLDVFAYELEGSEAGEGDPGIEESDSCSSADSDLVKWLKPREVLLANHVLRLARNVKKTRKIQELGMWPSEFLLMVLYFLDKHLAQRSDGARAIYVFSSETFINSFLKSVALKRDLPISSEFCTDNGVNSNKVFSEIQRLNTLGLIETRQRPTFHLPNPSGSAAKKGRGRTREKVYSTREDFRISHWGKHYVETELLCQGATVDIVKKRIEDRQDKVLDLLQKMAAVNPQEEMLGPGGRSRIVALEKFFEESAGIARQIGKKGGCVMIFRNLAVPEAE